jgi:hypothetical protein
MSDELTQEDLLDAAKAYLKSHYGEDTVRMDVLSDTVSDGTGDLEVECTVSVGGSQSDWRKTFSFRDGEIANMSARFLR